MNSVNKTQAHTITDKYLDENVDRDEHSFGAIAIEEDEVIALNKRFDMQTHSPGYRGAQERPFRRRHDAAADTHDRIDDAALTPRTIYTS